MEPAGFNTSLQIFLIKKTNIENKQRGVNREN